MAPPVTFAQQVYDLVQQIPPGRVTTYREIGQVLGTRAYRLIGQVLHHNPGGFLHGGDIPCHRVVGSDGRLVGFSYGLEKKKELLEKEGVIVENNRVQDFFARLYTFTTTSDRQ